MYLHFSSGASDASDETVSAMSRKTAASSPATSSMMTGQLEGQERGTQRREGLENEVKDQSVCRMILSVRKAIHLVSAIPEG